MIQHLRHNKRSCFYINLDPAAEEFAYEPDLDIKDLISLEDVMEEIESRAIEPKGLEDGAEAHALSELQV